jgi:beta-glucosidase
VASGDPTTTARPAAAPRPAAATSDDDDLAARLADPVLAAARAAPPAPTVPPDVWGRLSAAGEAQDGGAREPDPTRVEARARELLDGLSLHEKLGLLSGDGTLVRGLTALARDRDREPYVAGELPRLGLPGIRAVAGPRGVASGAATAFPVPMARAASFDPRLERRVGDAIGAECRALGGNLLLGVSANLARHPAWGRAQDTYGEDPHLVGELAVAAVQGVQGHAMACVAHLAGAATERGRYTGTITVQDDDLHDIDLVPFRRCVEAGAAAVMTAAHRLNGTHCGHDHRLVSEVLKDDWGFAGFVAGDLVLGVRSGRAVGAGIDLELPFHWRFRSLERLVRRGRVTPERVDDAALRLLRQQVRAATRAAGAEPRRYAAAAVAGEAHRVLAREAAERSMVLLRNHPVRARGPGEPAEAVLPLDAERVSSLVVLGAAATRPLTGDPGPSQVRPPAMVTLLDGLRAAGERWVIDVPHVRGDDLDAAGLAAAAADVAVVVAGPGPRAEGENPPLPWPRRSGGDRRVLTLGDADEALVRTVAAANPRTVVVLVGGSAIVTEGWREQVAAIVVAWHAGMEGGHALARVLFGEVNPGGRLPATWPRAAEQLPRLDPRAGTVRLGPLHGYRLMQATGRSPAFPFGFGLSYTTFEHGRPAAKRTLDGTVRLTVPVVNTGTVPGDEVVQVYVDEALGSDPRPLRTLRAFRRVPVAPGTVANVVFELGPEVAAAATGADGVLRLHVGRDADPDGHRTVEV